MAPADPVAGRGIPDSAFELLRCVALEPALAGILLLDVDPELIMPLGRWLGRAMTEIDGRPARIVTLGAWTTDEDLWVRSRLVSSRTEVSVESVPGLLMESPTTPPLIVVVPDLARASLAVHRAAVTLIGADTASTQRHGYSGTWAPRARWLVACRHSDAMSLSPHLLDRFAVRCYSGQWSAPRPTVTSEAEFDGPPVDPPLPPTGLPVPLPARARFPVAAIQAIVAKAAPSVGRRRDLAVAHVSRALATSRAAAAVTLPDVARAANLLGVDARSFRTAPKRLDGQAGGALDRQRMEELAGAGDQVIDVDDEQLLDSPDDTGLADLTAHGLLYPEDDLDAMPPPSALLVPQARRTPTTRARGQVIGIEQTQDLHDLAIVPTLFEAIKCQAARRAHQSPAEPRRLLIRGADLRRHRRRPKPGNAFILVLDHTCLARWDFAPVLAPYLRWAHEVRALVTVVEFGHLDTAQELRAERLRADNLTHPRIVRALSREPGRASPLAYAMDLAVDEIRHMLRRRYPPVEEALLLVATDGRGNVTLEASLRGTPDRGLGRQGIVDALSAARPVSTLRRVRAVVAAPDLAQYPELPFDLAEALGGVVVSTLPATELSEPAAVRLA